MTSATSNVRRSINILCRLLASLPPSAAPQHGDGHAVAVASTTPITRSPPPIGGSAPHLDQGGNPGAGGQ